MKARFVVVFCVMLFGVLASSHTHIAMAAKQMEVPFGSLIADSALDGLPGAEWKDAKRFSTPIAIGSYTANVYMKHDGVFLYIAVTKQGRIAGGNLTLWMVFDANSDGIKYTEGDDSLMLPETTDGKLSGDIDYAYTITNILPEKDTSIEGTNDKIGAGKFSDNMLRYVFETKIKLASDDAAGNDIALSPYDTILWWVGFANREIDAESGGISIRIISPPDHDNDGIHDMDDPDDDNDALLDTEEIAGKATRAGVTSEFQPTDPTNPDTDEDGIRDDEELFNFYIHTEKLVTPMKKVPVNIIYTGNEDDRHIYSVGVIVTGTYNGTQATFSGRCPVPFIAGMNYLGAEEKDGKVMIYVENNGARTHFVESGIPTGASKYEITDLLIKGRLDPHAKDTDGDGISDGDELARFYPCLAHYAGVSDFSIDVPSLGWYIIRTSLKLVYINEDLNALLSRPIAATTNVLLSEGEKQNIRIDIKDDGYLWLSRYDAYSRNTLSNIACVYKYPPDIYDEEGYQYSLEVCYFDEVWVGKCPSPLNPDTDGDGHKDGSDDLPLDQTEYVDSDGDGMGNNADSDDDNDGIDDAWESAHGLNPIDPSDAKSDRDNDGLINLHEFWLDVESHAVDVRKAIYEYLYHVWVGEYDKTLEDIINEGLSFLYEATMAAVAAAATSGLEGLPVDIISSIHSVKSAKESWERYEKLVSDVVDAMINTSAIWYVQMEIQNYLSTAGYTDGIFHCDVYSHEKTPLDGVFEDLWTYCEGESTLVDAILSGRDLSSLIPQLETKLSLEHELLCTEFFWGGGCIERDVEFRHQWL